MLDLTNYDYNALVERITELYQNQEGLGEGYDSSTGQMLIQLLADVNDHLFFMLERRAQEAFIETARLDSSVAARASELGYRPRRRVSSTGTVELILVDEDNNPISALGDVYVASGTPLFDVDGNSYVTTKDVTIQTGQSSIEIPIKEGVPVNRQYNFNQQPYVDSPTIVLEDYTNIEEFSLTITDGESTYSDVGSLENQELNITSLSYAMPDDPYYDIRYAKEGMRIIFGDGEFGKKPKGIVRVGWVASSGSEISVLSTGLEFVFQGEFLSDNRNVTPAKLYRYQMTNITPIRGGQDQETIIEIARNAPEFSRTANRAVTSQDHEFWVLRSGIGNIIDVRAYGEQETGSLVYGMNNVHIAYLTGDLLPLNVEQQNALRRFMNRFKMVTTHLVFTEATQVELVLDIDFKRNPQLPISNEQLYGVVKGYVDDYFKIRRGTIGGEFQHSEFVRYLQNRTFVFNNITYPITDWVKVEVVAQFPITIPLASYDVLIDIDNSYWYFAGDSWVISLDGENYVVEVEETDDKTSLVLKMREEIFNNTNFLVAIEDNDVLRIKSPFADEAFVLDTTQGDLASYVSSDTIFRLPRSTLYNPSEQSLILPGSVYIVDDQENVLFEDNGQGWMVSTQGLPSFPINYTDATFLSPTLGSGTYYVRFHQNEFQNFDANLRSALVLSDLADSITDPFLFSKLRIIQ